MAWTPEDMIEPVGRIYDALERADLEAAMAGVEETTHPDAEFHPLIGEVEGRAYRGYDAVREWFAELLGAFEVRYEDRGFRVVGDDTLVVLFRNELRGRGSGVAITQEGGNVFDYVDGKCVRGRSYTSHAEALAAAEASQERGISDRMGGKSPDSEPERGAHA